MSFFQQSTFKTMFSNDENSRPQNNRPKMPKIDLDINSIIGSIFSPSKSNLTRSCCENCNAKFSFIKSKKICQSCKFEFCSNCYKLETDLGTTRSSVCLKCRVFSRRPLKQEDLIKLKVKELKWFLRSHRISSSCCKEKSDLVDLIIQHFGLRNSNINNQSNQPGPSRRSFDDFSSTSNVRQNLTRNSSTPSSQNDSPLRSTVSANLNSDNSNESTIGSEWEFINPRSETNSINNSNTHSNQNSNQNSNHNSNQNSNNQSPTRCTPTNEVNVDLNSDFENLTANDGLRTEINDNIDLTILNDNAEGSSANNQTTSDDLTNAINRNSRLDDNLSNSFSTNPRRTASTSRLSNPNVKNLNKSSNLSESTESLSSFKNFNIADVKNEDEIRNFSVRQLKLVLTRNYVNYKGCCEKDELLEKAIRLWNQVKQDNDLLEQTKDEDLCKICMESVINCVLLECGHLVACLECGKRLSECPICRAYVVRAIRTFKS